MIHAISPAYVTMYYHSSYGNHSRTLPTLLWSAEGLGLPGTFDTHDGAGIDAEVMIESMIDVIAANNPSSIVHDSYTIFRVPVDGEPPQPVYGAFYSKAGSLTITGQAKAVQVTMSFRTTAFNELRLVQLDRPNANVWGNIYSNEPTEEAIIDEVTSMARGWAGRDGNRPYLWTNTSISLNKRLRRKYGMI